jgi:YidC/Oxa1 family membrane protein insertase
MRLIDEWRSWSRFQDLAQDARSIVFYAEAKSSWAHFEPLVRELTGKNNRQICYVTSDRIDPILEANNTNIKSFYIGEGIIRTIFFAELRADILIMTMPDLGTFQIKRSRVHPVHYIYVFHSMVSAHCVYRKAAFDNYDTIFCVGSHHVEEIRRTEASYDLRQKKLIEYGYPYLDTLMMERSLNRRGEHNHISEEIKVLVAPSWGSGCLIETKGSQLVRLLLDGGFYVTLRPHPMTLRKTPRAVKVIEDKYRGNANFVLESDISARDSLCTADCLITDWSGIAMEYAFAFMRPVLFIDVARKINNPDHERISVEPLEVKIRQEIGVTISEDRMDEIPSKIEYLCANRSAYVDKIIKQRSNAVFHVGCSGMHGAEYILGLLDK